jgi:acyl dehydratase
MEFLIESEISFDTEEMDDFAKFSGDFNPIHRDPNYAKLNDFPDRVVYGALVVSRVLAFIGKENVNEIRAEFINPVFLSEKLKFRIFFGGVNQLQIDLFNENQVKVRLKFFMTSDKQVVIGFKPEASQLYNPSFRNSRVHFLLGEISRLIGMQEPGELALIRAISLKCKSMGDASTQDLTINQSRNRFEVFKTNIDAGDFLVEGVSVKRNFKSTAAIIEEVKEIFPRLEATVRPKKIWIFGVTGTLGMRIGLLCALQGHEVYGVYRSAEARAQEVMHLSQKLKLNMKLIQNNEFEQKKKKIKSKNGEVICYCSSPRISTNFGNFDHELWEVYKKTYVDDLKRVIEVFPKARGYFVPSTIYLDADSPFKNSNAEYCMAKAEQEDLIFKKIENSRIFMPRIGMFPGRHSQISVDLNNDNLPMLLRQFNDWLNSSNLPI